MAGGQGRKQRVIPTSILTGSLPASVFHCKSALPSYDSTYSDCVLTPGRYAGAVDIEDDGEPFEQKMKRLTATLEEQIADSAKLEKTIRQNLKNLSHV